MTNDILRAMDGRMQAMGQSSFVYGALQGLHEDMVRQAPKEVAHLIASDLSSALRDPLKVAEVAPSRPATAPGRSLRAVPAATGPGPNG